MITDYLPPPFVWWIIGGTSAAIATWMLIRALTTALKANARARRAATGPKTRAGALEDWLTRAVAGIATGVSAEGMWRFTRDVLDLDGLLRILLFAFIELAMVTSAVRAKRNMREAYKAGVDGIAVWALACLTAILSSLDAERFAEAIFRLAAPLVAAWLWERGMRLERHRLRGTTGIHWRLTLERVLVWAGLAESTSRTAGEVDQHRRITRVALAAKKARALRDTAAPERKLRRAMAALDRALDKAVEHTALPRIESVQRALLDEVTTLYGGATLLDLPEVAPWAHLDHPAVTGAARNSEAAHLAEAMQEWTTAVNNQRDPEVSAAVTSMAAYIARLEGRPAAEIAAVGPTTSVAPPVTSPAVGATDERPEPRPVTVAPGMPLTVVDSVTDPVTEEAAIRDRTGDQDGDREADRERPDDQDNREAEEWIRRRCRGQNGVGQRPSKTDVADRFGFSPSWAWLRVQAVQARMSAQGYVFESGGRVLAPTRSVADSDADETSEESA